MAKIYGLFGSMQGKVADVVMAVRNGEQIVRKYQPIVSNPKSKAQVETRAKLKLLSQLGASLQPVIAIPRVGMVSPRNGFTQANYPITTFGDDKAEIKLSGIQLTKSSVPLGPLVAFRDEDDDIYVCINGNYSSIVDAVVYVAISQSDSKKVAVASSKMVSEAGKIGNFETKLPWVIGSHVVLAYGIRFNTVTARIAFGNIESPDALDIARLMTTRKMTEKDATLTETIGAVIDTTN